MDDATLLRYSRHIMLDGLDLEGQEQLSNARVLIIGLGGLGSPAALYLAASGVGHLRLADDDEVELSNLQRQILHGTADVGRPKTASGSDRLRALNPEPELEAISQRLDDSSLPALVADADVVLDGCDNFSTRFAVNRACVAAGVPLISGAVIRMEGQLAGFRPDRPQRPCYRCVFPDTQEEAETCSETGVLAPLPGVIGSLQAVEAIKAITGLGEPLDSKLLMLDALTLTWRRVGLRRDPQCPVCATGPSGDRA
jgi:adenylyltransferase/sulfurtransferase